MWLINHITPIEMQSLQWNVREWTKSMDKLQLIYDVSINITFNCCLTPGNDTETWTKSKREKQKKKSILIDNRSIDWSASIRYKQT